MTMTPKTDDPTKTAMALALVPLVDWLDCTSLAVNSLAPVNSLFAPSGASRTFSPTLAEQLLTSLEAWRASLRSCRSKAAAWVDYYLNRDPQIEENSPSWIFIFAQAIWYFWLWRNKAIFEVNWVAPANAASIIIPKAKEMEICLKRDQIQKKKKQIYVQWAKPRTGWVKINTDGCSKGNPAAELWGVFHGLQLAWKHGYRNVILELDSQIVARSLGSLAMDGGPHRHLIRECKKLLNQDWNCQVMHSFREGNKAADWLANLGLSIPLGYQELENVPSRLEEILRNDVRGVSDPRLIA
ncbi:hypothetical protein RJ640_029033 [Escallonia rubra]|uniref:RNase H type-1 domain-containing protein n=1 Tax=Escallonia rubra TaxID=112253 RepID=A0AA88UUE5_9ASTE|nr:hypothetical protein RJ640_029033 [Escallonia rubra]